MEADSECQDEGHHQAEIFRHLTQIFDRRHIAVFLTDRAVVQEKAKRERRDAEIDEAGAQHEQQGSGRQKWPEGALFILVQPRRDKAPKLHRDHRKGEAEPAEQRQAHIGEEFFLRRGEDQPGRQIARGHRVDQRRGQKIIDVGCKYKAPDHADRQRDQRLDQTVAQFGEVRDQRRAAGLNFIFSFDAHVELRALFGRGWRLGLGGWRRGLGGRFGLGFDLLRRRRDRL